METNPIQQRIEEFEQEWLYFVSINKTPFFILRTSEEDTEMMDAFFEHMLAIDNDIEDVAVLFKTPLNDIERYGKELIEELFYNVFIWNNSEKPEAIEENKIEWEPNFENADKNNITSLFVNNINTFCNKVEFEEDSNLVCVLDYQNTEYKYIKKWLSELVKLDLHPKVRILVSDTFENPVFNEIIDIAPKKVSILTHEFGLNEAIKQISSMGDPLAPDTKYRFHFIQLTQAIGKQNEKNINNHSKICLDIAKSQTANDPNWYTQIMVINTALATYEVSKKDYKKAIDYVSDGNKAASNTLGLLPDETSYRLMGQGLLFRGTLYDMDKKYKKAKDDFMRADEFYQGCKDYIMQIESLRMLAYTSKKDWDSETKNKALDKGVRLGQNLNPEIAEASSYSLLVKAVLDSSYQKYISEKELDDLLLPIFGDNWRSVIKNCLKTYSEQNER